MLEKSPKHAAASRPAKKRFTSPGQARKYFDQLNERIQGQTGNERDAWLARPHIHSALVAQVALSEEISNLERYQAKKQKEP